MTPVQSLKNIPTTNAPSITKSMPERDNKMFPKSLQSALRCTSNFEDTMFEMEALLNEHTMVPDNIKDPEVDILERGTGSKIRLVKSEDPDATEYSSSFGGTDSGAENYSGLSDAEVDSGFGGDKHWGPSFGSYNSMFAMRKRKLTNHWRNFIRPLMWRCKWTEIRMKETESQVSKYSRELVTYDQRKQIETDKYMLEGGSSKSCPFSNQYYRRRAMKRRKRQKVEDTTDAKSYMLNHNLFSYLEHKRSDSDGTYMGNEFGNPVVTEQNAFNHDQFGIGYDQSSFEFKEADNSLQMILAKIEVVQARVHKLKDQLEAVVPSNAGIFSSSENLSLLAPCDPQTSSAHSPTVSVGNGDAMSVGAIYAQNISEGETGDPFLLESAVSSYVEAFDVPDMIESTAGLLSSTDVRLHQPQMGDSCENMVDSIVIHAEAADREGQGLESISTAPTGANEDPETNEQEETALVASATEPDALAPEDRPQQQSLLKACLSSEINFPKNKRKRVERKGQGAGALNQKQPESQS